MRLLRDHCVGKGVTVDHCDATVTVLPIQYSTAGIRTFMQRTHAHAMPARSADGNGRHPSAGRTEPVDERHTGALSSARDVVIPSMKGTPQGVNLTSRALCHHCTGYAAHAHALEQDERHTSTLKGARDERATTRDIFGKAWKCQQNSQQHAGMGSCELSTSESQKHPASNTSRDVQLGAITDVQTSRQSESKSRQASQPTSLVPPGPDLNRPEPIRTSPMPCPTQQREKHAWGSYRVKMEGTLPSSWGESWEGTPAPGWGATVAGRACMPRMRTHPARAECSEDPAGPLHVRYIARWNSARICRGQQCAHGGTRQSLAKAPGSVGFEVRQLLLGNWPVIHGEEVGDVAAQAL